MATTAREHLKALLDALQRVDKPGGLKGLVEPAHAAANFLAVPEPSPKAFQQAVCKQLRARADAQHLPAKGVKRERAYIEGLMGAGMALAALGSDQLNPFLLLATLGTIRGAVDAVNAVADGRDLP